MRGTQLEMRIVVLVVVLGPLVAGGASPPDFNLRKGGLEVTAASADGSGRPRRQDEGSTTPKPRKNRPSNLFRLISVLVSETREDTNRAFNEIGTLFNSQFARSNSTTTMKEPTIAAEPPTSTTASSSAGDDEEGDDVPTTTEPFRVSREEFIGILRSNVQGLVNLFGKEFRVAIKDSNDNVREFGRDLGLALRPYFN